MFIRLVSIDLISLLIVLQVCMKFSSLVSLSAEGCAAGSPTPPAERLVPFWQVDRSFWGDESIFGLREKQSTEHAGRHDDHDDHN